MNTQTNLITTATMNNDVTKTEAISHVSDEEPGHEMTLAISMENQEKLEISMENQ